MRHKPPGNNTDTGTEATSAAQPHEHVVPGALWLAEPAPVHTEDGMHSRDRRLPPLPRARALDLLADPIRRAIVWELAHQPRTVTELARRIHQNQPTVSKHLRQLREGGLVEAHPGEGDGRTRVYDVRREPLNELHAWLRDLQQAWWRRTRHTPTDPDYYKGKRLDPNTTTRGTDRIRTPRQLKEPWER